MALIFAATRKPASTHINSAALALLVCFLSTATLASAQTAPLSTTPVVLDRVLVVVNQQVILKSDLDRELRLSILDPNLDFAHRPAPSEALEHLISRTLIRQQFADQPPLTAAQLKSAVDLRLQELRTFLPACVQPQCSKPEGWQAFLTESNLTAPEVESFIRDQVEILDFIEKRFRAGIHITPEQIADYYKSNLLPRYANPTQAPSLESVSTRINEILLEKQVNLLLEDWLTTLRTEGDVEFIDSSLATSPAAIPDANTAPSGKQPVPSTGGPGK